VPVNNVEAIRWLTRAANSGNIAANGMLGDSYHLGRDVPKDYVEARRYLATAAALGDPNAQYDLGLFYENGLGGLAMNLETAIELYYNSARRGYISSINALNHIGIVRRNPTALYAIGKLYENGEIYGELENRHSKHAVYLDGSCSNSVRQQAVDKFQNDEKVTVFVGNLKAAGVGLTLTAAEVVIMNDLSFVPAEHSQAEDRAYRYGQKSNVLVYYPIYDNTIEGAIYDILNKKKEIIRTVMGDQIQENIGDIAEEILKMINKYR
jgi:TPR repeat protein